MGFLIIFNEKSFAEEKIKTRMITEKRALRKSELGMPYTNIIYSLINTESHCYYMQMPKVRILNQYVLWSENIPELDLAIRAASDEFQ